MLRADKLLYQLWRAQLFLAIDLMRFYYQLWTKPEDFKKTAFRTPNFLYEFHTLLFGLANAPDAFQNVMYKIFNQQLRKSELIYPDIIPVFSWTPDQHLMHLRDALDTLIPQIYFATCISVNSLAHLLISWALLYPQIAYDMTHMNEKK